MITRSAADARIRVKAECHSFCPIGFSEYLRNDGKLEAEIVGGRLGYNTTYSYYIFVRKEFLTLSYCWCHASIHDRCESDRDRRTQPRSGIRAFPKQSSAKPSLIRMRLPF
jgi:hypothetical protein